MYRTVNGPIKTYNKQSIGLINKEKMCAIFRIIVDPFKNEINARTVINNGYVVHCH